MKKELSFNFHGTDTTYLTHSLHPYPAKFPPQLPNMILKQYARKGQVVLDPFCGSGTTLVEARLQGLNALGVDVNGLSVLLSQVKATPINQQQQITIRHFVQAIKTQSESWQKHQSDADLDELLMGAEAFYAIAKELKKRS